METPEKNADQAAPKRTRKPRQAATIQIINKIVIPKVELCGIVLTWAETHHKAPEGYQWEIASTRDGITLQAFPV